MPEDRRQKTDKAADRHPLSSIVRRPTSVEQAGNRFFRRRAADRFPDQGRHREDADVVRDPHRLGRLDRIGDDELLEAELHQRQRCPRDDQIDLRQIDQRRRGGAWTLDQIARLSDRLARDNHTHPSRIRSIVMATPGVVNPKSGAIEMAPNITGLDHLNVVGLLGEKLGSPVVLENDINLALLGEIWHGCAQNVANVAFLALGSGVGLGLYVNGQLVRGENGAAGEIGYLPIGGDPLQAESRLQGCLEYQIGATGVVRRYREAGGSDVDSERQVFERAQAGDPIAAYVVEETARLTALAAAAVIATVDPQLLVLGGSVGARPDFADKVARVLLQLSARPVEIRTSTLGRRAGVVGALSVALRGLHDEIFGVAELAAALPLPPPAHRSARQ